MNRIHKRQREALRVSRHCQTASERIRATAAAILADSIKSESAMLSERYARMIERLYSLSERAQTARESVRGRA